MAIRNLNGQLIPVASSTLPPRVAAPIMQPLVGTGGGATAPRAFDPSSLVPVSRAQPAVTTPQTLMDNRMATMPPSAFSGTGAATAVAPVTTNQGEAPSPAVYQPAVAASNAGPTTDPAGQQQHITVMSPWSANPQTRLGSVAPDILARLQDRLSSIQANRVARMNRRWDRFGGFDNSGGGPVETPEQALARQGAYGTVEGGMDPLAPPPAPTAGPPSTHDIHTNNRTGAGWVRHMLANPQMVAALTPEQRQALVARGLLSTAG